MQWGDTVQRRQFGVPFLGYVPRRRRASELLLDAACWSHREHLVQGDRRLTFGQVFAAVDAVASMLRDRGLSRDDRLLLLAANSPEWVITFWATLRIGAVATVGNSWWSAAETAHAVELTEPTLVLADEHRAATLPPALPTTALLAVDDVRALIDGLPAAAHATQAAAEDATAEQDEDTPAAIVFTAGTTGRAKPVVLAHRSLVANLHNLLVMSGRLPHQLDHARPQAVSLQSGPLFHIGGVQAILLAMVGGNRLVFLSGRFDAGEVLDLVERERVTWWGPIPTMASRVLDHPTIATRDLSSVRSISMGGAPVQPALVARLRDAFPNARRGMSTIYGMTETGGTVAAANGRVMADHPTTSGAPMPTAELRIDNPSPAGDGEIIVRTPGQMLGYWGEAWQPGDDLLDVDGFVHTGDLGRVVAGLLYVTGRVKDLIIRGGENIAPSHVESVLLAHPSVTACAVIGLPDADLGERVAAVVQLREGADPVTQAELVEHAARRLARFEVPAQWWIRRAGIPTTDAGKTDKRAVREEWAGRLTAR